MFENYTTAKTKPLPRWVWGIITVAIGLHVVALGAFWVYSLIRIDLLPLPKEGVAIAVSAPPPAPPPAKKGRRSKTKPKTETKVVKKVVKETVQPVKLDEPVAIAEPDVEGIGNPDGHEDGVAWSDCVGAACDPNSPLINSGPPPGPPDPPKKEEPKVVPQHKIEAQRVSGNKHIKPADATKLTIKRDGKSRLVTTVKMCLSASGSVNNLDMLKSSGYPAYDSKIKSTMRTWKYRPFKVNGKAVPVCTSVTFIYNQSN